MQAASTAEVGQGRTDLARRLARVRAFSMTVRSVMYHVTHACNLRCRGCWFFEYGFDTKTGRDERQLDTWRAHARAERARGVTMAVLIGGEPSLFLDRVAVVARELPYVVLSTNGLVAVPRAGFEDVAIAVTLFGGGPLDDELRGIRPSGARIDGLFETALRHYRDDPRVFFVYALTPTSIPYIGDVVSRIADNGNTVVFNFYSDHAAPDGDAARPAVDGRVDELLERALAVREAFPGVVLSHPYYIRTLLTGRSHWGAFGYDVCPSVSHDFAGNRERLANGNPTIQTFNVYAPDLKTVNMCCTSGECDRCRDSQAVSTWLLVSLRHFQDSDEHLRTWVEIAESYWSQFCWSPYHRAAGRRAMPTEEHRPAAP